MLNILKFTKTKIIFKFFSNKLHVSTVESTLKITSFLTYKRASFV